MLRFLYPWIVLLFLLVPHHAVGQESVRVQLKWYHQFQFGGYYAAHSQGLFEKEGLSVALQEGGPEIDVIETVLRGDADFGIASADLLAAHLNGDPLVAVAPIFQQSAYVLISTAERPVFHPAELAGKKVMASGGVLPAEIAVMLLKEHVDPASYQLLPIETTLAPLVEARVDLVSAYITDQPYQLIQQGKTPVLLEPARYGVDFYGDTLFTTQDYLDQHPQVVEGMRRASLDGWAWALEHPSEVVNEILAFPTARPVPLTREQLDYEAAQTRQLILPHIVELGHSNMARWERMGSALVSLGLAPEMLPLENFLARKKDAPGPWLTVSLVFLLLTLFALALLLASFVWSRQLQKQVQERTSKLREQATELEQEVQERRVVETRQRRLVDILEATTDFVGMCDANGVVTYVNRWGRALMGIGDEEELSKYTFSSFHPQREQTHFFEEIIPTVIEKGFWFGHTTLLTNNGSEITASQIIIAHKGADGVIQHFSTIARDITTTRRVEQALRESRRTLLTLVRNLPGMAYRCKNDRDWTMEFCSSGCFELTGCLADELIDNRVCSYGQLIYEEERERTWEMVQDALAKRVPFQFQYRLRTRTGEQKWVWEQGRGVFTKKGTLLAIEGFIFDITQTRVAEEAMTQLRVYLKNVIDSMPSILVGVDINGRVTHWNSQAEEFTSIEANEALGASVTEVLPMLEGQLGEITAAIRDKRVGRTERKLNDERGGTRMLEVMIYPLTGEGIEGAVIRLDDITQRVKMEEVLVQTEKMMLVGGLAAGMAHEINNPLGGIVQACNNILRRTSPALKDNVRAAKDLGFSIEALQSYMGKRRIDAFLGNIQEACDRIGRIVSDMLAFSRAGENHFVRVSGEELLETAIRWAKSDIDMKGGLEEREIRIVFDCQPDAGTVDCDPVKIQQVLLNLIRNAVQACQASPAHVQPLVMVRAFDEGDFLRIEVADNGPGMSEEVRRRAFEPFFTTKEVGVGTGLGLSVSYFLIVDQHKGTIEVESQPGNGARFIIRLPRELHLDRALMAVSN